MTFDDFLDAEIVSLHRYAAVASELGITQGAARTAVSRALAGLRIALDGADDGAYDGADDAAQDRSRSPEEGS